MKFYRITCHLKWRAEGVSTLADLAQTLEQELTFYKDLLATGKVDLSQPVDNGYVFLQTEDPVVAEAQGFEVDTEDDEEDGE